MLEKVKQGAPIIFIRYSEAFTQYLIEILGNIPMDALGWVRYANDDGEAYTWITSDADVAHATAFLVGAVFIYEGEPNPSFGDN